MRKFQTDFVRIAGRTLPALYWRKQMKHMYLRVKELPQSGEISDALGPALAAIAEAGGAPPRFFVQVTLPHSMSPEAARAFVDERKAWMAARLQTLENRPAPPRTAAAKRRAKAKLVPIIERLLAKWVPVIGVAPSKITYRFMKTRWGSCSGRTGNISFNLQLADYPEEVIEYVVVHELCHFLEPNHGPGFWREVERHLPDWRARRRALR